MRKVLISSYLKLVTMKPDLILDDDQEQATEIVDSWWYAACAACLLCGASAALAALASAATL